jgi:hypothetical protein
MSSQDWDESFIERFKQSHKTEMVVAVWLLSRGNEVKLQEKHLRLKWEDRLEHADEGDLIVNGKKPRRSQGGRGLFLCRRLALTGLDGD